ncbi:2-phospho-L-lactate guanylyltransferase [Kribbia dieselivorans]|uniref:2-phospho-L-lactate guanylyltransferase n=1 Tax=Kribbia dieselivorans TaxID=331526 RepID=UPI000838D536|nr:2-phospho-L-lactate guanylyltransferase [Kribbia dieselivorans]
MFAPRSLDWTVIIPVRGGSGSKSRLETPPGVSRELVATAIARDSVVAAIDTVGARHVLVITADPAVAGWAERRGATAVIEPRPGLNLAVGVALNHSPGGPTAVLLGDVPALRPEHLRAALDTASALDRAFVPDRAGRGTVLLTGAAPALLRPRFGPDSAARHRAAGHREIAAPARLRLDVDTAADLELARQVGLGRWTRRASTPVDLREDARVPHVQASVHSFDARTGRGSVLLDDGVELSFDAAAFDASGLRTLNPGERLRVVVEGDSVTSLWMTGVGESHRVA